MRRYYLELVSESGDGVICLNSSFSVKEVFFNTELLSGEQIYQQIVFEVSRKPKQLILHLQRIHFTYTRKLTDQLYAAVVDLLWILDGRGHALSQRMISATHSLLSEAQSTLLSNYLLKPNRTRLLGNKFSVFSSGLVGSSQLLTEKDEQILDHDPLQIAQDYIEYSQLDAAIETLENAVFETPDREVLQTELLELYKVTKNAQAFTQMHSKLLANKHNLTADWQRLVNYFEGTGREE